jgi:hypothetical protein
MNTKQMFKRIDDLKEQMETKIPVEVKDKGFEYYEKLRS